MFVFKMQPNFANAYKHRFECKQTEIELFAKMKRLHDYYNKLYWKPNVTWTNIVILCLLEAKFAISLFLDRPENVWMVINLLCRPPPPCIILARKNALMKKANLKIKDLNDDKWKVVWFCIIHFLHASSVFIKSLL